MKPPANESPAPVGSCGDSSGNAEATKTPFPRNRDRAVLALLDQDDARALIEELARRHQDVVRPGILANLRVVHEDGVDLLDDFAQDRFGLGISDPEIHRVQADEFRLADLLEDVELQRRHDVRQIDELGVLIRLGQLRLEIGKDVELRVDRVGDVEVVAVVPDPAERRAVLLPLQAIEIDLFRTEPADIFFRKVGTDRPDQLHGREQARGKRKKRRRAPQDVIDFTEGRLDVVERHRTYD